MTESFENTTSSHRKALVPSAPLTPQEVATAIGASHSLPLDGQALTRTVPPENWCVTRNDLRRLKAMVKAAVHEGSIVPTPQDPFHPGDSQFGPSIHTVNTQFIKPITALAGNCSWALMCHPDGGQCDVFVTHSWQEGLYEFVDSVLESLPHGTYWIYCCMLSNPQNLDIGKMLVCPIESPFAKALHVATHMLVVPNHTSSIYSRIWCTYEAFLAYTWKKNISTAELPVPDFWAQLLYLGAVGVAGMVYGYISNGGHPGHAGFLLQQSFLWMSMFTTRTKTRIINFIAMFIVCSHFIRTFLDRGGTYSVVSHWFYIQWDLSLAAFFILAEADRMWSLSAEVATKALTLGYTGKLCDAQSSNDEDKLAILEEIASSGGNDSVEQAVNILILTGMSSPSLQQAASKGVKLESRKLAKASFAFFAWFSWFSSPLHDLNGYYYIQSSFATNLENAWRVDRWAVGMLSLVWLECLICGIIWLRSATDRKRFTNLVVVKVFWFPYMLFDVVFAIAHLVMKHIMLYTDDERDDLIEHLEDRVFDWIVFEDACIFGPAALLFAAMGPGKLAHVPVIGVRLAQFILHFHVELSLDPLVRCFSRLRQQKPESHEMTPGAIELGVFIPPPPEQPLPSVRYW